jgi:hypothetical protein
MDIVERRRAERYPACENRVRLLWEDGPEVLETSARLIDISGNGARFVAETPPPPGHDVYFRLEAPSRSGWVSARVVRSGDATEGGLSFARYSPRYLLADLT